MPDISQKMSQTSSYFMSDFKSDILVGAMSILSPVAYKKQLRQWFSILYVLLMEGID